MNLCTILIFMVQNSVLDLSFGFGCDIGKARSWDVFHSHDEVELAFFHRGEPIQYRVGGHQFEVHSEDTLLFWGAVPHQLVDISSDNLLYWLTIPPKLFLRWDLPPEIVRRVMDGQVLIERNPELRTLDLHHFPLWKKESLSTEEHQIKTMALSVEARLRRFMDSQSPGQKSRGQDSPFIIPRDKNTFKPMYDFITLNFRRKIYIEEIAAAADIHPNYAIKLFRQKCGINIVDYITMLRVYEAQRLLLTTDMKVIDIAMEAGFCCMSNFYKSFKKICNRNPKEYRKVMVEG